MTKHTLNEPYLETDNNGNARLVYTVAYGPMAGRRVAIPVVIEQTTIDIAKASLSEYIAMKYGNEVVDGFIAHLTQVMPIANLFLTNGNDELDYLTIHKEYTRWMRT